MQSCITFLVSQSWGFVNLSIHFFHFILPSTRLCNLLWYVCSRGPLRLIFLTALLLLPFPSTFDLHIECCITASCRPRCLVVGLPAWHPDEYGAVTLTVECVRCVVKGRKELQVCGYDRTGNMFGHVSLIRHSPSTTSTPNSPALVLDVSQDPTRGCCWGRKAWEVQLIDNKRLWLSSLSFSFLRPMRGLAGKEAVSCRPVRQSELKVDIFVFEYGWLKLSSSLLMLGWFCAFSRRF